jgi:hypothetical protein
MTGHDGFTGYQRNRARVRAQDTSIMHRPVMTRHPSDPLACGAELDRPPA